MGLLWHCVMMKPKKKNIKKNGDIMGLVCGMVQDKTVAS